ncbi:uncharacterized calcium-binding protein At1g02270-like isoform X2 [Cornus florida]|uniref:uncharacterized calcium-binding protein At1g02270-like isoform X2 n=1 Tax=Cornus florida TaxID=4283 RepID=UPI00289DB56C|nr:uncharacterized calcium-binding protein At1g02270-like isoform X2 [Cornus florida]
MNLFLLQECTCESMGELNQEFCEQGQHPDSLESFGCVSCTTFNILAPIYKRLNGENCESECRELWLSRNQSILDRLLDVKSSIICLQEFWVRNEELVRMYENGLKDAGYVTYRLARTNNRGDGLLTAVHQNNFRVLNYRECQFNDIGDRVAQLLHVELLVSLQNESADIVKGAIVVNTHLIFPHDSSYCFLRLKQVYKILQYIESYCHENHLPPVPIILCGDWNGSKKGNVYKFLRSQGFISSYDTAHCYTDNDENSFKWVSHRNHRGDICGVDFIWLLNPNKGRKPLKESFIEAVLGNIHNLLVKVPTEGVYSPHFLETDGSSYITYSQFSRALTEVGLSGHPQGGLSNEDIKDLWEHIDTNGDGVINLLHFARAWNPWTFLQQIKEDSEENETRIKQMLNKPTSATSIGFNVSKAALFPPEVESGMWPDYYFLSDHALLTVEFSPLQLHNS